MSAEPSAGCSPDSAIAFTVLRSCTGRGIRRWGADDDDWLPKVGQRGWTVLATDFRIFERPHEYEAYLKAGVSVFLMPSGVENR
ncbi:hypothetical protein ACFSTC_50385 [Nonomuraea ferruginea]